MHRLREAASKAFANVEEVAAAYAFGSRIKGNPLPGSDLDIALLPHPGSTDADPLFAERMAGRFAESLGTDIEIDCRLTSGLPLRLTGRIVTEGVLIYDGDPPRRVEFETSTRRHYFDFLPLIERDARERLLAGR